MTRLEDFTNVVYIPLDERMPQELVNFETGTILKMEERAPSRWYWVLKRRELTERRGVFGSFVRYVDEWLAGPFASGDEARAWFVKNFRWDRRKTIRMP